MQILSQLLILDSSPFSLSVFVLVFSVSQFSYALSFQILLQGFDLLTVSLNQNSAYISTIQKRHSKVKNEN